MWEGGIELTRWGKGKLGIHSFYICRYLRVLRVTPTPLFLYRVTTLAIFIFQFNESGEFYDLVAIIVVSRASVLVKG
jgi:hypothetical protein